MTIIKAFLCVLAIVAIGYLLVKNEKRGTNSEMFNATGFETIERPIMNEEEYISFRLMLDDTDKISKIWEFPITDKLTIIGRETENFKTDRNIQNDRTFSREHMGFYRDKSGTVCFTAIKGVKNPVYVGTNNNQMLPKVGNFVLPPGTHIIKMGETVFEVYFRDESVCNMKNSDTKPCLKGSKCNDYYNNKSKTRLWGI